MKGTIIKGLGGLYTVSDGETTVEVKAKGTFRKEKLVPTVGDFVEVADGMIVEIFPRKNLLIRPPVANIDKLFVVSSLKDPEPDFVYIDKMTVIAARFGIKPVLVFTKNDLATGDEVSEIYAKTPYKVIFTSTDRKECAEALLDEIKGSVSAFAGFSGVGKSSLLNMAAKIAGAEVKSSVGDVSKKLRRGKHTTRHVEVFAVNGGFIADTPGFGNLELSFFGIKNRNELAEFFPEFSEFLGDCRFTDCNHIKTKDCAVIAALEEGKISPSRYESYKTLYENMGEYKFWEDK